MKKLHKIRKFKDFTEDMFLIMCIFSGCDYLHSLKGVGLKRAIQLVDNGGKDDTFLEAMTILRSDKKIDIPSKYEKHFMKAFLTFKFQRVYCPQRKKLVHLFDPLINPHGSDLDKFEKKDFLG
jgi:exonuclease 1